MGSENYMQCSDIVYIIIYCIYLNSLRSKKSLKTHKTKDKFTSNIGVRKDFEEYNTVFRRVKLRSFSFSQKSKRCFTPTTLTEDFLIYCALSSDVRGSGSGEDLSPLKLHTFRSATA
jgi:hypothetical protein